MTGYVETCQWFCVCHWSYVTTAMFLNIGWLKQWQRLISELCHYYIGLKYSHWISFYNVIKISYNNCFFKHTILQNEWYSLSYENLHHDLKKKIGHKRNRPKYSNCVDTQKCRGFPYIKIFALVCSSFPHKHIAICFTYLLRSLLLSI